MNLALVNQRAHRSCFLFVHLAAHCIQGWVQNARLAAEYHLVPLSSKQELSPQHKGKGRKATDSPCALFFFFVIKGHKGGGLERIQYTDIRVVSALSQKYFLSGFNELWCALKQFVGWSAPLGLRSWFFLWKLWEKFRDPGVLVMCQSSWNNVDVATEGDGVSWDYLSVWRGSSLCTFLCSHSTHSDVNIHLMYWCISKHVLADQQKLDVRMWWLCYTIFKMSYTITGNKIDI